MHYGATNLQNQKKKKKFNRFMYMDDIYLFTKKKWKKN